MADAEASRRPPAGAERRAHTHRLEPGRVYFDLDDPGRGPFVATGDEDIGPGANIVAQDVMDEQAWESLLTEGWGTSQVGSGHQAYDQGAFGQEDDPRMDVLNAAPPGVGEGLTPKET